MNKAKINIELLFDIPDAVIYDPDKFVESTGVSIDSRKIEAGEIFFAITGDLFDGHDFVEKAVDAGAAAVVINEDRLEDFDDIDATIVTVPDTVKAFGDLARLYRAGLKATVISITGSNGKTTLKEMLYSLLSVKYNVVKTIANNNNHIGVPLTIFSCGADVDYLILEQGTNHFGEIKYTAEISCPDIAVITNIGDSHLEYLIDREGVLNEKSALFEAALSNGGKIFVNMDDTLLSREYGDNQHAVTYGSNRGQIYFEIAGHRVDGRPKVKISSGERVIYSGIPLWGESNISNLIPAVAIAMECKLTDLEIEKGIASFKPAKGRLDVKSFENFIVVDDTYNANPASMHAAFTVLKDIRTYERKILFLGDMFELGSNSTQMHKNLAPAIISNGAAQVYLTGELMKNLYEELHNKLPDVRYFENPEDIIEFSGSLDKSNSVILVKGSRGMKMERVVKKIIGEN